MATQAYTGAHFATFPEELVRRCVMAGTSERGCCPICGRPWVRIVERGLTAHDGESETAYEHESTAGRLSLLRQAARERGEEYMSEQVTAGWRPGCACGASPVPCTVLDPFVGSGTTVKVAVDLGRRGIGCDLNPAYLELARERGPVVMI